MDRNPLRLPSHYPALYMVYEKLPSTRGINADETAKMPKRPLPRERDMHIQYTHSPTTHTHSFKHITSANHMTTPTSPSTPASP